MNNLQFVKDGKDYKVMLGDKQVGKMYKDNKRNHMFAVVVKWNFKVKGYRNDVCGKTYKAVKVEAEKSYNRLMELVNKGHELVEDYQEKRYGWM